MEEAFHRYEELDAAARVAFLDELTRSDPDLAAQLRAMLDADSSDPGFLDPPTSAFGRDGAASDDRLPPGTRLGAYEVVEWVASGGMGAVYRAERADREFEQTVALKVLKTGAHDAALRNRFHQERQTLAFLNHPNVAKLIDGGTTDDDRPYLVMEFVDGKPIDVYCDEHALPVEGRLALFADICDAVHHLHQNLVVHRDIKPSNILVDAAGRPKLLDFGIAKLLDTGRRLDEVERTLTGERLMTPQFASPEQVRGESVTTASDVYSLGVLLYRLLTGHEPYPSEGTPLHEYERAIGETDPQRPSTAVRRATTRATANEIARGRGTSVKRLRRRLSGDLDTIVLMAMRKKPEHRYGSAAQFGEDVRRVLERRPVRARRTPLLHRAVMFAQRNRLGAALAAALVVSLVAGAAGILWWANRTHEESLRADREAESARVEARNVSELNRFLNDMLTSIQPGELGAEAKVEDVLDQAAVRLKDDFPSKPVVEARLRVTLGQSYLGLGDLATAEEQFREAVTIARRIHPGDEPKRATYLTHLARVLSYRDQLDEAGALLAEAEACFRSARDDESIASVLAEQASLAHSRGDLVHAERLYRRVNEIRRASTGSQALFLPRSLADLAEVLANTGARLDEAEALLVEAIDLERLRYSDDHPNISHKKVELAHVLWRAGDLARAFDLATDGSRDMIARFGERNVSVVPSLTLLGALHLERGEFEAAESQLRRALEIQRASDSDGGNALAYTLATLGNTMMEKGDAAAAIPYFAEALEVRARIRGPADAQAGFLASSLCTAQRRVGDYDDAKASIERSIEIYTAARGPRHPSTLKVRLVLGHVERQREDPDAAAAVYRAALDDATAAGPPAEEARLDALFWLATVHRTTDRPAEAAEFYGRVADALDVQDPAPFDRLALVWDLRATCLSAADRLEEAEELLLSAHARLATAVPPDAEPARTIRAALGRLYRATDRPDEAARYE